MQGAQTLSEIDVNLFGILNQLKTKGQGLVQRMQQCKTGVGYRA
jgi:hypothetical protein